MASLEKEKQFYKEIPTGTGRESEPKESLPAIEVDNRVIWVNPDFPQTPLDLKEGEPTKLGLFLTPEKTEKSFPLKVIHRHGRSGLLGQVIFKDKQGRLYRDLDLKGMGHISSAWASPSSVVERVRPRSSSREASGLLDRTYALWAKEMAEKFLKAGIRTERYIALIKLKEIVNEKGEKISISEAKEQRVIPNKMIPIVVLRAFGTKNRLEEAQFEHANTVLKDARIMVAQELGIKERNFSLERYLEWFAKTLGENVGLIHKNEWYHGYLYSHNITLDCRIVDLDSVDSSHSMSRLKKENRMKEDYKSAEIALYCFNKLDTIETSFLKKVFSESYIKNLGYKPEFIKEEEYSEKK